MSTTTSALPKPRPYRRFLTSVLHTRFVYAASLTFLLNLHTSFWTAERNDVFWSWFPLGPAGIKAALFSISSLFIFILQIENLTVGRRNTTSKLETLKSLLTSHGTLSVFFWYTASACWFCEVFVFTSPESKELGWIIPGGYGAPNKMNERPIYLRMFFAFIGIAQAVVHLYGDCSSLKLGVTKVPRPQLTGQRTHPEERLQNRVQRECWSMIYRAGLVSGLANLVCPFLYTAFFRGVFWRVHVNLAKTFVNLGRSEATPPGGFYIGSVMLKAFVFGTVLILTWDLTILLFQSYLTQEPLKAGLPLTASSKDPNGSLLNGLTAKKEVVKSFAFWELAIISQSHPERRQAIFADFERPEGPVWAVMLNAALKVVSSVETRIQEFTNPSLRTDEMPGVATSVQQETSIPALPRLLPEPTTYNQSIFAPVALRSGVDKVGGFLQKEAQIMGSSPKPWSPPVDKVRDQVTEFGKSRVNEYLKHTPGGVRTAYARLVQISSARTINSVILGSPVDSSSIIVDAVEVATKMLVASLTEDAFGKAVQGVPATVKQFTRTIQSIESFVNNHPLPAGTETDVENVTIVHSRLKASLRELLGAFQVFLNDVGLAIKDLNDAHKAAEDRPLVPKSTSSARSTQSPSEGGGDRPVRRREMDQVGRTTDSGQRRQLDQSHPAGNRSGRLFKQLDSGYVEARSKDGNVFGATDFNPMPGRQRVALAR